VIENFYALTFNELQELLKKNDLNESGASLLYNSFYKKLNPTFDLSNLAKKSQAFLKDSLGLSLPSVTQVQGMASTLSGHETLKFLVELEDQNQVECVLIPFQGKYTLCLSSQVGCAMKCSFCYTGTQGLTRSLRCEEIVGQLMAIKLWLKERELNLLISNIVFMGQGEPLHNFKEVKKACEIFLSQYGLSLGREKITISTAGYLPGLKEWLKDPLKVNLALSFHCPQDEVRSQLIPLNQAYPVREILNTIKELPLEKKRFVTFEVLLIKDLTDHSDMAHETAEMIKDLSPLVNLIPFNPFPGSPYERPSDDSLERYKEITESYGIPTMIRKTKGDQILAACGQLKS
jgi:23S rRNA (adenine2503-C2)-methyltransferase